MGRKSIGTAPMTAAERQRRRRTRLAGLHAASTYDPDQAVRQLRAQLIELERDNQQLRQRLQGSRPVIAPAPAPTAPSAPTASGWLNRVVASRKR